MKIKKVRNVGILLIIAIFSFSSCSLIFNENVDADLSELAAFASGLDTAVRMIAIDADVEVTSRTVNADTYTYDGGSVIIQNSPYDTYEALNSGGTNLIDIPGSNKYLQNFYGNPALTAKFSMKPVGDYYEIKLFIYDAADFLLEYVYEEYYVTKVNTGGTWAPLDKSGNSGFIDYYDKMTDGSKIDHTEYEFGPVGGNVWDIDIPTIVGNLNSYQFTTRSDNTDPSIFEAQTLISSNPARNIAGDFDSYKESTGNYTIEAVSRKAPKRPAFESITYYAELPGKSTRNMVIFSLQGVDKEKKSFAKGVTRSQELYSGSPLVLVSKELHSLITIYEKEKNIWQQITKDIAQTVNGSSLTVIDQTEGVYYENSTVDGFPDKKTEMILTQTNTDDNDFAGTMSVFWKSSSKTDNYTVTYDGKNFKTKKSNSRAAVDNGIELDLSLMENGKEFTLNLPGGNKFEGTYFNGRLTGSIKYPNGDLKGIDIIGGVVLLDNELWEPDF